MVASMTHLPRTRLRTRLDRGRVTLATVLTAAATLLTALVIAVPPAAAAAPCSTQPTGSPITEVPWVQQRYDYAALSQITDGTGITVAVIDSGVNSTNPQLAGTVDDGIDVLTSGGDGRDDCVGHGTGVASLIAARPRSGIAMRGLAPGVRILPVRVSERIEANGTVTGAGSIADLATGIRSAIESTPTPAVLNLSISTTTDDPNLRAAIRDALAADIVVVAAVGNHHDRGDPTPYPAAYPGVLGVGGIGPHGQRVAASQVGPYVDIVAPGEGIVAAAPSAGHVVQQGTSFATPLVAASVALIRARWPNLRQADVVHRLLTTADPAPGARPSGEYGYGVLNPMRALNELVPPLAAAAPDAALAPLTFAAPLPATNVRPSTAVLVVAAALLLGAASVAAVAAAVPAGRRRRWRPDRAQTPVSDPSPSPSPQTPG
jgi:membrane-anchored mycosin MYCP